MIPLYELIHLIEKGIRMFSLLGVREDGTKLVLSLQGGDKESASAWREFFKDLKKRGLDRSLVQLGIMDGLTGLEKVFYEEFSHAKIQHCQVHVARNVLASSRKKADELAVAFAERWGKDIPSAVKCLSNSLDSCLTFFTFPEEEWISLRTTNVIERLNKEFKRRTKPMEIVAGENACYLLLAFISLKMEASWRSFAPL
jgi:putative transposase